MQQTFEESEEAKNIVGIEQPAQTLPALNLTEPQTSALPQVRKRLMSRRKYALRKAQVLLLKTSGYGLSGLGLAAAALLVMFVCLMVGAELWTHFFLKKVPLDWQTDLPMWAVVLNVIKLLSPFALGACLSYCIGKVANKRAVALDTILLIQTSTADLFASDSLVRASEEPKQGPQTVLLRAATASEQKHEEQLVRAAGPD